MSSIFGVGLNFVSSVLIARYFGAGAATDSLVVALTLALSIAPPLISPLDSAFLPHYYQIPSWRQVEFTRQVVAWFGIGFGALGILIWVLRAAWLPLFLRGTLVPDADPLLALGTVCLVVVGIGMAVQRSILTAEARFGWMAGANLLMPGATVLAIVLLHHPLGPMSALLGLIAGSALALILSWSVAGLGLTLPRPSVDDLSVLAHMTVRYLPVATGALLFGVGSLVLRAAASLIGVGGISGQYYAERLFMVPHTLIAVSAASVFLPFLIRWGTGDSHALSKIVVYGVLLMAPITVVIFIFAGEIVRISLEHGSFTTPAAAATTAALRGYSLGLVPLFITTLVWRILQLRASRVRVLLMPIIFLAVCAACSVPLVHLWGFFGIGLANTLAASATTVTAIIWTRPARPTSDGMFRSLTVLAAAGASMSAAGFIVAQALVGVMAPVRLATGIIACAIAYFLILRTFRISELGEIRTAFRA